MSETIDGQRYYNTGDRVAEQSDDMPTIIKQLQAEIDGFREYKNQSELSFIAINDARLDITGGCTLSDQIKKMIEKIEQLQAENERLTRSIGMVCRKENALKAQNAQLVNLIKLSYRNWLEDPDVAWGELGEQLCDGLCNSMGDKEFQEWLKNLELKGSER